MKTIKIGTKVGSKGVINALQFIDLFNYLYVIEDQSYTLEEIQDFLTPDKTALFDRMIMLLEYNSRLVFKFLEKKTIDTRSLPKINQLNVIIQELWTIIEDMDTMDYESKTEIIKVFKKFWYILSN